jgi:hypothetical protein
MAQEDFLFHLYRGSELLQENRVVEAKEELEYALTMQPLDAKGQDLLGAVYFRLGLYPRAIQIYEELERQFPRDTSIKINLALAYLKTGQAEPARRVLKETVSLQPEHRRAWGYLGLALQKLGEIEQAQAAFERGGQTMMARRMTEKRRQSMGPAALEPVAGPGAGVREMAEVAFSELDSGELRFSLAQAQQPRPGESQWQPHEMGDAGPPRGPFVKTLPPPAMVETKGVHESVTVPPPAGFPAPRTRAVPTAPPAAPADDATTVGLPPALALPGESRIGLVGTGALVVRISDEAALSFAGRLDAVRVVAGAASTRVLHRRTRDAELTEVLGGVGSPMVRITGQGHLVLGPRPGHTVSLLSLDGGVAFVLEERLLGFQLGLAYESGRIALEYPGERARGASEGAAVVQLRGAGSFVLELAGALASVASPPGQPLIVRREWLVGWFGRLVAQALAPADAPGGQRGLIGFSGEGSVLVCVS